MSRATLRGTRVRLDASPASVLYVCDLCQRNVGPFATTEQATAAGLIHWDEWHRTHRTGHECVMPGCEAPHVALGYCRRHYMRVRRTGDPNVRKRGKR